VPGNVVENIKAIPASWLVYPINYWTEEKMIKKGFIALAILWIGATTLSACAKPHNSEKDSMPMVLIPAGDTSSDPNAQASEFPQHSVYLDSFTIDQHEVTNSQYALCVRSGACTPPPEKSIFTLSRYYGQWKYANYPVVKMNWNQANAYCQWAGRRLPTEAEWEKAARGTDGRLYPWGNAEPEASLANFWQNAGVTAEVCSYPNGNSPYGLCDMAGNAWEWVADWYGETYYQNSPGSNPTGPTSGVYRSMRGGDWYLGDHFLRAANRGMYYPNEWDWGYGIRCAR
jgi:formylglycine-generating enzyme required for sulfatase activity